VNVEAARPPKGCAKVGEGEHSWVFRPSHGGAFCLQYFKPHAPELTPDKVEAEYAYLVRAYAHCPGLIPDQLLLRPAADARLCQMVLVKQWVEVDEGLNLGRIDSRQLPESARDELAAFIATTRALLDRAADEPVLLPDIIDDHFRNLVVDMGGHLRLVDTNRLINTNALRRLAPGQRLDTRRKPIHGRFFGRLLHLESAFTGRARDHLAADDLYLRYLTPETIRRLLSRGEQAGEPA
jgi:hypothetical protein